MSLIRGIKKLVVFFLFSKYSFQFKWTLQCNAFFIIFFKLMNDSANESLSAFEAESIVESLSKGSLQKYGDNTYISIHSIM